MRLSAVSIFCITNVYECGWCLIIIIDCLLGPCFKAVDVIVQGCEQYNWRRHPILRTVSYANLVPEQVPAVSYQVSYAAVQSNGSISPKGSLTAAASSPKAAFQSPSPRQSNSNGPILRPDPGLAVSPSLAATSSVSLLQTVINLVYLTWVLHWFFVIKLLYSCSTLLAPAVRPAPSQAAQIWWHSNRFFFFHLSDYTYWNFQVLFYILFLCVWCRHISIPPPRCLVNIALWRVEIRRSLDYIHLIYNRFPTLSSFCVYCTYRPPS